MKSVRALIAQKPGRDERSWGGKGVFMPADTGSRILRLKAVLDHTGLSRSTLYRKIDHGTFPKQMRISEQCVGWREG
jgi:prophage regulatory protein